MMMGDWQQLEVRGNSPLQKNHGGFVNITEGVPWKCHYLDFPALGGSLVVICWQSEDTFHTLLISPREFAFFHQLSEHLCRVMTHLCKHWQKQIWWTSFLWVCFFCCFFFLLSVIVCFLGKWEQLRPSVPTFAVFTLIDPYGSKMPQIHHGATLWAPTHYPLNFQEHQTIIANSYFKQICKWEHRALSSKAAV